MDWDAILAALADAVITAALLLFILFLLSLALAPGAVGILGDTLGRTRTDELAVPELAVAGGDAGRPVRVGGVRLQCLACG